MKSATYYHATLEENRTSIIQNGLQPSVCSECTQNKGVHVTDDIVTVRHWVGRLRNERDLYYAEFIIIEINLNPNEYTVVTDEYIGHGPDGKIICTTDPLPPETVGVIEWL